MINGKITLDDRQSGDWAKAVDNFFFPVETVALTEAPFSATLQTWQFGDVSLAVHSCDPVHYRRNHSHIRQDPHDCTLITFPVTAALRFKQENTELVCRPGRFFLEFGHKPYEFTQQDSGEMWSIKVPSSTLRRRLRGIESYAPHTFDTTTGPGSLLFDVIRNAPSRLSATDPEVAREMGRIIIDLLLLTLEADPNVLGSQLGSVQKGHVARMQAYIRRNLADPSLTPETVAQSCGISTRYLHGLFRSSGTTVSRWILDQRLEACHADLAAGIGRSSVAEIAFRWGFSDHAHFSRHYKRRFGITPRERRQARALVGREEAVLF